MDVQIQEFKHIKRPQNSFMIWSSIERQKISISNPTLKNSEISKLLGIEWAQLPDSYKLYYKYKANLIQLKHTLKYPDYKYQPNKKYKDKGKSKNKDKAIKILSKSKHIPQKLPHKLTSTKQIIPTLIDLDTNTMLIPTIEPDYFTELQVFYETIHSC